MDSKCHRNENVTPAMQKLLRFPTPPIIDLLKNCFSLSHQLSYQNMFLSFRIYWELLISSRYRRFIIEAKQDSILLAQEPEAGESCLRLALTSK